MKILITGVSGFVGGRLAQYLAQKHHVWGVYHNTQPERLKGVANLTVFRDDLSAPRHLPKECEYVIHAAADTPATTQDETQLWRSNYEGMCQLLQWSQRAGVSYFLYCSTMAVYGNVGERWIDEQTPSRSPSVYGASKLAAEKALKQWTTEQATCASLTIRLPGVVGHEAKDTFLPRTVQKILRGESVTVHRKSALFNNIVHVEDLARFTDKWPSIAKLGYTCFNAAATDPIPLETLAQILMEAFNKTVPVEEVNHGRPPFLIDTEMAKQQRFPLDTTRNSLVRYAKEVFHPIN